MTASIWKVPKHTLEWKFYLMRIEQILLNFFLLRVWGLQLSEYVFQRFTGQKIFVTELIYELKL